MITTHSNNFFKKPHLYLKKKKTNIFYNVTPYDEERERERESHENVMWEREN